MNAARYATVLRSHEINVLRTAEGDEDQDGAVYITESVHVQIPTSGSRVEVCFETDAGTDEHAFNFLGQRKSTEYLKVVADIHKALASTSPAAVYKQNPLNIALLGVHLFRCTGEFVPAQPVWFVQHRYFKDVFVDADGTVIAHRSGNGRVWGLQYLGRDTDKVLRTAGLHQSVLIEEYLKGAR